MTSFIKQNMSQAIKAKLELLQKEEIQKKM